MTENSFTSRRPGSAAPPPAAATATAPASIAAPTPITKTSPILISSLPSTSSAAPSPRPTPPSSTTTIPPQCFPSPTSVAELANSSNPTNDDDEHHVRDTKTNGSPNNSNSSSNKICSSSLNHQSVSSSSTTAAATAPTPAAVPTPQPMRVSVAAASRSNLVTPSTTITPQIHSALSKPHSQPQPQQLAQPHLQQQPPSSFTHQHISSRLEHARSALDQLDLDDDDDDDLNIDAFNFPASTSSGLRLSSPSSPTSPPPPSSTSSTLRRTINLQSQFSRSIPSSSCQSPPPSNPSSTHSCASSPPSPSSSTTSFASSSRFPDFSPPVLPDPLSSTCQSQFQPPPPPAGSDSTEPQRLGAGKRTVAQSIVHLTPPPLHPHLANPTATASAPLASVSKSQFQEALHAFVGAAPPAEAADPPLLLSRLRRLLDNLDALNEQLPLKVTNALFDALSKPAYLHMLVFLLSDVSARSTQAHKDVRKTYRYPYIVTTILANGNIGIRDAFMGSTQLVNHMLSYLDGHVPLALDTAKLKSIATASIASAAAPTSSPTQKAESSFVRDNQVIVINLAQILVSYLETNPDPLLRIFNVRPTVVPSLTLLLHIGSIPQVISSIIPDRCVDELTRIDPAKVKFDDTLTTALNVLARASIFHLLAEAFIRASQTLYSLLGPNEEARCAESEETQEQMHKALQVGYNVTSLYSTLVTKVVRAVRINSDMPACSKLNVYANSETSGTLAQMVRAGVALFRETGFRESTLLQSALNVMLHVLRTVEADRERRVPSVSGQPPPLQTDALDELVRSVLEELVSVLIDLARGGAGNASVRVLILDVMGECTRLGSVDMMRFINDRLRFGNLAFHMMVLHPRNSALHQVVCRAVETALLSPLATKESVQHWLVKSDLVGKIATQWSGRDAARRWSDGRGDEDAALLSGLVHLACCVHHWIAATRAEGVEGVEGVEGAVASGMGSVEAVAAFERFWTEEMGPIVAEEVTLCGPKPKRKATWPAARIGRSFGVLGATSGRILQRGCGGSSGGGGGGGGGSRRAAHSVRSDAGHRFGFVEPGPPTSRVSRFDELFDCT